MEDEGDAVLEEEGKRLKAMMRPQPRTKEDDMRDELFSTSRNRAAAHSEGKGPSPPPLTTTEYRPLGEDKDVEPRVGGEPADMQSGESGRKEEEEGEGEGEGEGLDIN